MKTLLVALMLMALTLSAAAGEALPGAPASARVADIQTVGAYVCHTLEFESGEQAALYLDSETGAAVSLTTLLAVEPETDAAQDRQLAEAAVLSEYPDALILFGEDADGGALLLHIISPGLSGAVQVHGDVICRRELTFGAFMREGRLTMDGALAAMSMYRPAAEFRALELEEDDGQWSYEGEALIDGREYEFEISAATGKLLEWERD